jgi:hypothetical protein
VTSLPELRIEHDGIFRDCSLGMNAKEYFPSSDNISKGILEFVHSYLCGPVTFYSLSGIGLMDETVEMTMTGWLQ